jgi:hypothetical protein
MEQELRRYFERGVCPTTAHVKTGYNLKTVCKYYGQWSKQLRESEGEDFLQRQQDARAQIILSYDEQILSIHEHLEQLESVIVKYKKQGVKIPHNLFSIRLDMIKFLSSLIEKKGLFTIQPLPDEIMKQKISEMIKHDPK